MRPRCSEGGQSPELLTEWRSDRLEWVIKNGFADWFAEEMRAGRTFFPITVLTDERRRRAAPSSPCAETEWFWYAQIVGQGRVNLSNLRGLTDKDVEGVIGTGLTQRGSPT
jgi:hypothetical protein